MLKLSFFFLLIFLVIIIGCDKKSTAPVEVEWDYSIAGDVNLNGVKNEIADAVVFSNYFIYGTSAFAVNVDSQIIATEIDHDGSPLGVSDFQRLVRTIVGDARPIPTNPSNINVEVDTYNNNIYMDYPCGAVAMTFDGHANVFLADGAFSMELISNNSGTNTKAFIYSLEAGVTCSGNIIYTNGQLLSIEAAGYDGEKINARIIQTGFNLSIGHEYIYPNVMFYIALPKAANWDIIVLDHKWNGVDTVANLSGYGQAGYHEIQWNASELENGHYECIARAEGLGEDMVYLHLVWDNEH